MIEVYIASAFSKENSGGNKAGVVIKDYHSDKKSKMQISKILGFSETAFITKSNKADFKLEYFTPTEEVDLCGHATIGTFTILNYLKKLNKENYKIETNSGILNINIDNNGTIIMEQNIPKFYEKLNQDIFKECLDISYIDESLPIQIVSTGLRDIMLPIKGIETLNKMKLNLDKVSEISRKLNVVGIHAFSILKEGNIDAICRNFAPLYGIDEESATGTSNCALASYLHNYGFKQNKYIFEQGYSLNAPSRIIAEVVGKDEIERVYVGGEGYFIEKKDVEV